MVTAAVTIRTFSGGTGTDTDRTGAFYQEALAQLPTELALSQLEQKFSFDG